MSDHIDTTLALNTTETTLQETNKQLNELFEQDPKTVNPSTSFSWYTDRSSSTERTDERANRHAMQKRNVQNHEHQPSSETMHRLINTVGNMFKRVIRKIRNVDESEDSTSSTAPETIPPAQTYPVLSTRTQNFTLNNTFCDCHSANYKTCRQKFQKLFNISLEIPISRHFSEDTVKIIFDVADFNGTFEICNVNESLSMYCHDSKNEVNNGPIMVNSVQPGKFEVPVRSRQVLALTLRYSQVRTQNLCNYYPSSIGTAFKEYNFRFYRVCK